MLIAWCCVPAMAHDGAIEVTTGTWDSVTVIHEDAAPWKGTFTATATNSSASNVWGGFHFEIVGMPAATAVTINPALTTSTQVPFTTVAGVNGGGFATLDIYFYSAPVNPGQTATFSIYTDNTAAQNAWFGVAVWPLPIPEPASALFLGLGGIALIRRRR